ncbi:hypothetical protein DBP19_27905 [Streptomyces sp. CS090A]|nr:hypothetical protein DBP19_27905 [Streptomyces sp. CS090A]
MDQRADRTRVRAPAACWWAEFATHGEPGWNPRDGLAGSGETVRIRRTAGLPFLAPRHRSLKGSQSAAFWPGSAVRSSPPSLLSARRPV